MDQILPYPWRDLGIFNPIGALWLSQNEAELGEDLELGHVDLFSSCREASSAQEEIFIKSGRVVHSIGQRVIRVYSMPCTVLQACWCTFQESSYFRTESPDQGLVDSNRMEYSADSRSTLSATDEIWTSTPTPRDPSPSPPARNSAQDLSAPSLCLLMETELAVRAADGASFTASLPFRASRLWDAGGFLLLQAKQGPFAGSAPALYSMRHPLDEPRPLTARLLSSTIPGDTPQEVQEGLFPSTLEVALVCTGHEPPLAAPAATAAAPLGPFLILFDRTRRQLGGWHVDPRPAAARPPDARAPAAADEGRVV